MTKTTTLTPKERNRIRQIRELLDLYERMESSRPAVLLNLTRAVTELSAARSTALAEDAKKVLRELRREQ